jgi:hypothetical protein
MKIGLKARASGIVWGSSEGAFRPPPFRFVCSVIALVDDQVSAGQHLFDGLRRFVRRDTPTWRGLGERGVVDARLFDVVTEPVPTGDGAHPAPTHLKRCEPFFQEQAHLTGI